MGKVAGVGLRERRAYGVARGELLSLSFVQKAPTGEVRVDGERRGSELRLRIDAGGESQSQSVPIAESLDDVIAAERLARRGEVGATASFSRYDPSIQKTLRGELEVGAVEQRAIGGVPVRTVRIDTRYPEIGVEEHSFYDDAGKILESRVGGFFVARLEPEAEAKRLDYHQDVLVSAVVPTPAPIRGAETLSGLRLRLRGFGAELPPASERQRVRRDGDGVVLDLRRDPPLAGAYPPKGAAAAEELAATPFIQADAPRIRNRAAAVVGDATTLAAATERLCTFVHDHVVDEYVPAYSNALEALDSGRGDCTEHATLFVAMARAAKIPARVAVGVAYWPPGNGFGWHAWAEVEDGGRWVAVDPTWNQPIADATHIKLAGGGPAEQARVVMLLGQLQVVAAEPL
jgi:transglutaminase-like putative cysteine protease